MANQRAWSPGGAASADAGSWFEVAAAKERVDRKRRITPAAVALRAMAEGSNPPCDPASLRPHSHSQDVISVMTTPEWDKRIAGGLPRRHSGSDDDGAYFRKQWRNEGASGTGFRRSRSDTMAKHPVRIEIVQEGDQRFLVKGFADGSEEREPIVKLPRKPPRFRYRTVTLDRSRKKGF